MFLPLVFTHVHLRHREFQAKRPQLHNILLFLG
jgi:hypothetical protein